MCGIAGAFRSCGDHHGESLERDVSHMLAALVHRGPDGEGSWSDLSAGVCFGHRRLSIIDVSPSGAQPMESSNGRYVVTTNGEFYNYVELRRELESTGTTFVGTSDTEVFLEAIVKWGWQKALSRAS